MSTSIENPAHPEDISIRTDLRPGDLGYIIYLHGDLYGREYRYGIEFEMYVAQGLTQFYAEYDPARDRVWIAEHRETIVGCVFLVHRGPDLAQLRYFLVHPAYRGLKLGTRLFRLFMECLLDRGYRSAFLWTTHEQTRASAMYRAVGFTLTEEKISTGFGKPLREQRYDLRLAR